MEKIVDNVEVNEIPKDVDKRNEEILKVYLKEYEYRTNEIQKRTEYHQRIMWFYIVLIGFIITITLKLIEIENIEKMVFFRYYLVITPLLFHFLVWIFSNEDFMIVANAKYIHSVLKVRISEILETEKILDFEELLNNERKYREKNIGYILSNSREVLFPLIMPLSFSLSFIFVCLIKDFKEFHNIISILYNNIPEFIIFLGQYLLFIFNLFLIVITYKLRIKTRKNYEKIIIN